MTTTHSYYLARDVRELDRLAIEEHHIPGFTLMQRAGQAAFEALMARWPDTKHVICFCGTGNNGGDGFIIAALAKEKGLDAHVFFLGDRNPVASMELAGLTDVIKDDATMAHHAAQVQKVPILPFKDLMTAGASIQIPAENTVLVDALLGTGLTGDVRGTYRQAIKWINQSGCAVLSVDIPSGLCSDSGAILGNAVKADMTVTFIGRKLGLVTANGPSCCGEVVFDNLGVPDDIYRQVSPALKSE